MNSPLVQKVIDQVRRDIVVGNYAPKQHLGPERVLCKKYGASRPTLRAAIARLAQDGLVLKHPHRGTEVAPEVRQRLKQLVNVTRRMIFIQMWNSSEALGIAAGLGNFASEHPEIEPLVIDVSGSYERCLDVIEHFTSRNDGFFMRVYPYYEKALDHAVANGQAVVLWGRRADTLPKCSTVTVDEFSGGYSATDHLIREQGVPVYYLGYDAPHGATRGRHRGWAAAMIDHGFPNYENYFLRLELTEDEAVTDYERCRQNEYEIMLKLFQAGSENEYCIFAMGDYTATSIYKAAKEAGLEVGRQVFVVGYHDRPLCERLEPPLSSVSYSAEAIGYEGAKLLYDHMTAKCTPRLLHRVLPVKLVIRRSSSGDRGVAVVAASGHSSTDEKATIDTGSSLVTG